MNNEKGQVSGYYGASRTPCIVFYYTENGGTWYAVEGSLNINYTHDRVEDGVDVEDLEDVDTGTASYPIADEDELEQYVAGEDIEDARKRYTYTAETEVREAWSELLAEAGQPYENAYRDNEGKLQPDMPAEDEGFNNFVDGLQKNGNIPPNYGYAHYDEDDQRTWGE